MRLCLVLGTVLVLSASQGAPLRAAQPGPRAAAPVPAAASPAADPQPGAAGAAQIAPPPIPFPFGITMGEPSDEPQPPVEGVSMAQFNAAWQANLDVKARPARDLIAQLAKELGLSLKDAAAADAALSKPLTGKLVNRSKLSSIEAACRKVGYYPAYAGDVLTLNKGARPYPVAFAGPFSVAVQELKRQPGTPTGNLRLVVQAFALPSSLRRLLDVNAVTVEAVVDAQGQNLQDAGSSVGFVGGFLQQPRKGPQAFETTVEVPLKNLLRGVTAIAAVRGKLKVRVPTKVDSVQFAKLEAGATRKIGKVEVTLRKAERRESSTMSFDVKGGDVEQIQWTPLDAQGKTLALAGRSSFTCGSQTALEIQVAGRPTAMSAALDDKSQTARLDKLQAGASCKLGTIAITLKKIEPRSSSELSLEYRGAAWDRLAFVPRGADGRLLKADQSGGGDSDGGACDLSVSGAVASLGVSIITGLEEVSYDFELANILLPTNPTAPEWIEAVQFPGHAAPASLEFVGIDRADANFPKVKVRVINHANKAIRSLAMTMFYLDAAGKELKNWPSSHSNEPQVVAANAQETVEVTAFFMPAETQSIRFALKSVTFVDATDWQAKPAP